MIIKYSLLFFSIATSVFLGHSDKSQIRHKKIYIYLGNIGRKSHLIAEQYHIKPIFLIGGAAIDPENKGVIDSISLKQNIENVIPINDTSGIAILDWEGKSMDKLATLPTGDSEFDKVLNQGIEMIRIAKEVRPEIKWGIYALPLRNYWAINEEWRSRCFMLIPLLRKCDVITPSVYQFYPDSLFKNENKFYIENNVRLSLNLALLLKKPVLPFVTHRFGNSSLIPKKEVIQDIDLIFKTHYLDNKVTGIIWWGPDEYYYRTNDKQVRSEIEKSNQTFSSYFDNLVSDYLSSIVKLNSFWNK